MHRLGLAALFIFLLACGDGREKTAEKPVSVPGEKVYVMKGTIVSRNAEANSLSIDHEAIPGFMEAMTMDYPVRGSEVASLPADHARIEARLHVHDDRYWVSDVKKAP
jgi:protein SCO1/2